MTQAIDTKVEKYFSTHGLRKYPKGQILMLGGDDLEYVYYLVEGRVKQYDVSYRGDEIILNIFKPSSFFPMALAINGTQSNYIYEAETDIEIRQAPAKEVVDFLKQNPDVMFDLLSRVYRGLDGLMERIVHIMSSSAKHRLVYELIVDCKRFGVKRGDGGFLITVNERDLGARAGLSRETVSREMKKLKTAGLVDIQPKGIVVTDLVALSEVIDK